MDTLYIFSFCASRSVVLLWPASLSGMCAKLHTVAASNNRDHASRSFYCCLYMSLIYGFCSARTFHLWWNVHSAQCQRRGCNNIPPFLQWTALITCSLCEGCTWHDLHILVTAPFCCDRKARAAYTQSFTMWQQATIDITCRDHSVIACLHYLYMGLFLAHILFMVNCAFSAMPVERLQQHQIKYCSLLKVKILSTSKKLCYIHLVMIQTCMYLYSNN